MATGPRRRLLRTVGAREKGKPRSEREGRERHHGPNGANGPMEGQSFFGQVNTAALKNLEILQREELPRRSAQQGKYLLGLLEELRSHPTVGDVRGLGLMCAIELVKDKATKEPFGWGPAAASHPYSRRVAELMEERGLLTRAFMSIQLCPPLVISKEEIDQMVTIVDESLSVAEREFGFAA